MKKTGRKSEPDPLRQKAGRLLKKKLLKPVSQNFKAEAELKESEERYRLLFENSGEAILLTNPDGSIYSANPAACRMYGRTEHEICKIGRNGIIDLNDPRLESAINERKKTGKFIGELNQIRKDGTLFPAEVTSTVYRDTSGNERTSMIIRDISKRRKVEKELHLQSEIMNNIAEGVNLIRLDDETIVFTNPKFEEMFGYEHGEMIGKHASILNAPAGKSPEETKQDIVDTVKRRGEWLGEILNIKKNSDQFWCYVNISIFDHADYGKVYLSVHSDINKRKQAEGDLKQSLDWQKAIFEGSRDAIFISDQDSHFVAVNQAAADLTGYSQEQLLKMRIPDIHDPHDLIAFKKYNRRILGGEEIMSEAKILRGDGLKVDTEFNNRRIFIAGNHYMHTTARDITERKLAEGALRLEKENFRHSLDDSPLGIRIVSAEGNTIYANQAILNIYGYDTLKELQKTPLKTRYTAESYAESQKRKIQRKNGDLSNANYEIGIIRKDGGIRYLQAFRKKVLWNDTWLFQVIYHDITERKLTEAALRESEQEVSQTLEFNRKILSNSSIGILTYKKSGQCISANAAAAKVVGTNIPQLLAQNFHDISSWKKSGMYQKALKALDTGIEQLLDVHLVTTFGKDVWLSFSFSSFDSTDEQHLLVFTSDITERKLAEERLGKLNDCFLRFGTDTLSNINLLVALCGEVMGGMCSLYNRLQGDMLCSLGQWNTPPDFKSIDHSEGHLCNDVLKSTGETTVIIRDLQNTSYALTDPNVQLYHLNTYIGKAVKSNNINIGSLCVMFQRDIIPGDNDLRFMEIIASAIGIEEARKQADNALRESEARFRNLFENSLLGISITNPEGRLIQVNMAYAKMYGYNNPEEILAEVSNVKHLYVKPEDRNEVIRALSRHGFMEPKEFELVRRDGSRFFVLVSISQIRSSDGKLLYNQATHIDLTERRKMESELRNSKELLENLYQHLNEVRENERATISREIHDELGQSMTALKLDLNQMHKYVGTNPEAIIKLDSMIELVSNTIKDVQRISSDLRPGILDDLGLVSAIEWYCDEFEKRTGIKCSQKLENSAFSDPRINLTFFRALQEALTNVIRHAKASYVNVKLHQSNKGVTLTIQDNGIGIPEVKIKSYKSMGLISMRERVRQLNGKIDISSKKGDGTKLTVFIPF
jgi:PAS domain S-box-containing protein